MKPARHKFTLLKQVVETIPAYLVSKLARKHGVDKRSRSFSPWSHVVAMFFSQLSHSMSLNDVCDTLHHHDGALATVRHAQPPSRNGLSHANKVRGSEMAKDLFFMQLKQTLKLSDFLGYSENAVQWQIWIALLTYVILRFIAYMGKWKGTFARLFTTIRGVMWSRFDLYDLLKCCGTAPGRERMCMQPQQLYLPLFVK